MLACIIHKLKVELGPIFYKYKKSIIFFFHALVYNLVKINFNKIGAKMEKITVFYDYSWPFVYNATVWLQYVKYRKKELILDWRHFQLEKIKNLDESNINWNDLDLQKSRSLITAISAEAAKLQGPRLFDLYHSAILDSRHNKQPRLVLNNLDGLIDIAVEVGLNKNKFVNDINNQNLVNIVEKDHKEAVERYGVFGTPTLIFDNNQSVFVKTFIPKNKKDYILFFDYILKVFRDMPFVGELKRPQPPWPKGLRK